MFDIREKESIHKIFAERLAADNFKAGFTEEIGTVLVEVPCIVEKRGFISSRDEEESFRNKNKVSRKSNGSVGPTGISSGPCQRTESQTYKIGELSGQVDWSDNLGDLKGKRPKLYTVFIPRVDPKVQEFESQEEI